MNVRLSREDVQRFADWSGDRNPLHVDPAAARATFFRRPVAHGMLSAIRALGATDAGTPGTLDIEFRGALFPDTDSVVEVTRGDEQTTLTLRANNQAVLIARVDAAAVEPRTVARSIHSQSGAAIRSTPAVLDVDDLTPGTIIEGVYPAPSEDFAPSAGVPSGVVRILALSSYVVGMELPGLRSLFTRATFSFAAPIPSTVPLSYRVEVLRFDPQFRMLETQLDVATADGTALASARLRSYVRFTPVSSSVPALKRRFGFGRALAGKVALVTGGTRGLGADLTAALAAAGCRVYASYHSDDDAARRFEEEIRTHALDVEIVRGNAGNPEWCSRMVDRIRQDGGRLDVLVLNACAPPVVAPLAVGTGAAADNYLARNLSLARAPLATMLPLLNESRGVVNVISSSFVEDAPAGFADYVALKQAVEALVRSAVRETPGVSAVIARPPRLQTAWNDTPTSVLGTMPSRRVAVALVEHLASGWQPGEVVVAADFPESEEPAGDEEPDVTIALSATFTADAVARGMRFWFRELGIDGAVKLAPYGQVLQTLLDPAAGAPARGVNVVLLRVRDWLRDADLRESSHGTRIGANRRESSHGTRIGANQREASQGTRIGANEREFCQIDGQLELARRQLETTAGDFERAMRAHRGKAAAETVLILCPSGPETGEPTSEIELLVHSTEQRVRDHLVGVPGLHVVAASDAHAQYGVSRDDLVDPIREKIAHIPYRDTYMYVLSTVAMREVHRRLNPPRKVVVVDCDNTLWRGIVGEVGAEGIEFDESHLALHERLAALSASGVLVCLCSKNEEEDVWRVFGTRADLRLRRDQVVASTINWQPKSENIRRLAVRLNLGLDSFIFIDDNPVECAEVRAACPEVLVLQWPVEPAAAIRLLRDAWELAPGRGTAEDARRTEMYREEFRRQELQDTLSFAEFLASLDLRVEARPLDAADLKRASQLTLRTNQFNFTTRRRDEGEMQALLEGGRHDIRAIRVRDRFGDYGLVGLTIAERVADRLVLDTFLLSCRVLGRGVEHHLAAELGRTALAMGLTSVRMRIDFTKRNTPAQKFLRTIVPEELRTESDTSIECDVPADRLASLRFEPGEGPAEAPAEGDPAPKTAARGADGQSLRGREAQIARAIERLATPGDLRDAIDGKRKAPAAAVQAAGASAAVYQAFSSALGIPVARIEALDSLEALGCDSFKIVEITVALIERFPSLPPTLLFEHRTVSEIARQVSALSSPADSSLERSSSVHVASEPVHDDEDIAVVGMHARCAGANSPEELWTLLSRGEVAVAPVPRDRPGFLHELADTRPHWAGLLQDVARFDAELFGVAPREADVMDPQLRLFLEVAWAALEDGGCLGREHDPDTGVFVGVMYSDYAPGANIAVRARELPYRSWESFSLANRLSQLLGFRGPSLSVDTACSSSATALHFASRALRAGDCNVAVVGGVNLILDPDRFVHLGRLGILSMTGRCLAFGAEADGTVLGEGAGAVVLRRLSDARARGDRILGIIKSTGVSTGSGTVGFTAPNPQAQAEAVRRALAAGKIDPRTVSYVETHGTGTSLGDPIEVRGLTLAHARPELRDPSLEGESRCGLGSIKPNIGHLEAGAGVLGLIKVLLQLQHRTLLPSVTSPEPNPQIPFAASRFYIQRELQPWDRPVFRRNGESIEMPRRAALSSFGVGGSNAHVIIEEAPESCGPPSAVRQPISDTGISRAANTERSAHLLALSARNQDALRRRAGELAAWLTDHPDVPVADAFFSINTGRRQLDSRAAIVADTRDQALTALAQLAAGQEPKAGFVGAVRRGHDRPKVAFLFTGQGSQHARMGAVLYDTHPVFRDALDRCAAIFDRVLGTPLLRLLFAAPDTDEAQLLNQTGFTQPALFSYEYALACLWQSWGVTPDFVMGHSVGEIGAMCVAGGISLEDGLEMIAARGRLMQALPAGGAMASVMAEEARVAEAIAGRENLALAAINGPRQIVISGDGAALAEVVAELAAAGIKATPLTVSHAFHSPLMQPMIAEYAQVLGRLRFSMPDVPLVSGVHGGVAGEEVAQAGYWIRNVLDPVRFSAGMATLAKEGARIFLEIGPQPTMVGMGRHCVAENVDARWLASARRDAEAWSTLLGAAGQLHVGGVDLDWKEFDRPWRRTRVSVPAYPFGGKRHWIAPEVELRPVSRTGDSAGGPEDSASARDPRMYEVSWVPQPALIPPADTGGHWVVLADRAGTGIELVRALEERGGRCTVVFPGPEFASAGTARFQVNPTRPADFERVLRELSGSTPRAIVSTWATDAGSETPISGVPRHARDLLASAALVVRTLAQNTEFARARVWFVTRGAVAPDADSPVSPAQRALWGFGRTAALEHPEIWGGVIDLPMSADAGDAGAVAAEIVAATDDDQVAVRGSHRYVPRLVGIAATSGGRPRFRADATYLVTGGTGAIGRRVCRWLVDHGARRLLVTSRRGAEAPGARDLIASVESLGAHITVIAADVSRPSDVDAILAGMRNPAAPGGIFHVAGIDAARPLIEVSEQDIAPILEPKVDGAWLLHERSRELPLEYFVCFSSISSVLGAAGRAHYAAANAFLDGLAEHRRSLKLPALSISWGPWTGGGIATPQVLEQFERIGNHGLAPEQAIEQVSHALLAGRAHVSVAAIDWARFRPAYEARRPRPLVSAAGGTEQTASASPEQPSSRAPWVELLARIPPGQREQELARLLLEEVADTLGYDTPDSVSADRTFQDMGMDSLMSAEFAQRVQKRLGTRSSRLVFEHPRVSELAGPLLAATPMADAAAAHVPDASLVQRQAAVTDAPIDPRAERVTNRARIVAYSGDLEPLVYKFQEDAWPGRRRDWIAPRWNWMFVESARRLGLDPQVWLYRDNGRIAGHNGAIPVRVKLGDGERTTAWLVDTMVLEEYRSQAVGARLMVQAHEDLPFALSLGQTQQMRDIQLRLGWEHVAPLQTAQFLIRPERVLKGKLPPGASAAAGFGLRAVNAMREAMRGRPNFEVRPVERFGEEHDRLWENMAATVTCAVRRDASYLNWKYVQQPGQNFIRLEVRDRGRLRGLVVLVIREADDAYRYHRGLIVDLVAPIDARDVLANLVQAALDAAARAGADALNCLHIDARVTAALQNAGFRLRTPERHLLVRPAGLDENERRTALAAGAWFVTQGDSDIDRPW